MNMPETGGNIVYPPGVRDITEDISTDDLVRRLKDCAQAFQNMSQDDDNSAYVPLALRLASESFLEHNSRDIQLLVACCIADVFRVFAPEAPYKDLGQLKVIFEFFVDQLKGLEAPQNPSFKRYFYLLENFSCVKTFNICVELEDNQVILCRLFKLMFKIINDNHSAKVKKFMLDMLSPLISEADVVSQELLDILLNHIIEPMKSQNKNAYILAQEIFKRTSTTIEPYIQNFFNNALILGKTSQSNVAHCLYDLIYELNSICPSMLVVVLPQLEFKLKSNEEKERLEVTKVLARMFSDKSSQLAEQNKSLWSCFLGRFTDISIQVRTRCVQYSMQFLLNHPELRDDITEQLKQRQHDPEESVRLEVVNAIITTAKTDFSSINEDLLKFVKERTLDKKFKIRKAALLGLAQLYKEHMNSASLSTSDLESISWIKNKVLHVYYQTSLEDRLLVERILHTCLVPYQSPMEIRMKQLYQLFATVDDHSVKAFKEILKCQNIVRIQMRNILELILRDKSANRVKTVAAKVSQLCKSLQDSTRSQDHILKFCKELESNLKLCSMLTSILNGNITCTEAEHMIKDILKTLGLPVQTNPYYVIIKQLLERIAPVLVDKEGICYLISFVKDCLIGDGALEADMNLCDSSARGLELLHALSFVFPSAFHDDNAYNNLLLFLQTDDESAADITLQILMNISTDLEKKFPEVFKKLVPMLENFIETGTVKQAKHAVYCLNTIVADKEAVFGSILENLKKHFTLESQYFRTALVSVGHIAFLCHDMFATQFKNIVAKIVVKDLLMLDQDLPRGGEETWGPLESLPDETKAKIEGMKLMVRWLMGLKDMVQPAISTLRLLTTVLLHRGDLMERQYTAPLENSWMRFTAATCMLKLCQEPNYASAITLEQFQVLAAVIHDPCFEVREHFAQKLHKGLMLLKLPLEFLAIYVLSGIEEKKEFKQQIKTYLLSNINKRRDYIKHHPMPNAKLLMYLPDYVLPYAIHLLAHAPFLTAYDDVPALLKAKDCLWLVMEPLMTKTENYSFSFYKRLLENIKQTKDKQAVDDVAANMKLYAVCDLALGIMMSKTTNFVLKDISAEPSLPSKYFTCLDKSYSNMKTYLPQELITVHSKKTGFEIEMFEAIDKPGISKSTAASVAANNLTPSASEGSAPSIGQFPSPDDVSIELCSSSANDLTSEPVASTSTSNLHNFRTRYGRKGTPDSQTAKKSITNSSVKKYTTNSPVKNSTTNSSVKTIARTSPTSSRVETLDESADQSHCETDQLSIVISESSTSNANSRRKRSNAKATMSYARTRSTRHSASTRPLTDADSRSDDQVQNGVTDSDMISPNARHLIKSCNVSLRKDEVEKYSSSPSVECSENSKSEKTLSPVSSETTDVNNDSVDKAMSSESRKRSSYNKSSPSSPVTRDKSKTKSNTRKAVEPVTPSPNKRKREISTEKSVKKAKSNTSENSNKQMVMSPKTSKPIAPVKKAVSLSSSVKTTKSRTSVSSSPTKITRTSNKKTPKSPLLNGTRSGGNMKKVVEKQTKTKPKAAKQPILKKGKKPEGKQATRRR